MMTPHHTDSSPALTPLHRHFDLNISSFSSFFHLFYSFNFNSSHATRMMHAMFSWPPDFSWPSQISDFPCQWKLCRYGMVCYSRVSRPLDTLSVISRTILWVRWPNEQHHSTEGRRFVNQVKGQSHQAQLIKRLTKECNKKITHSTMKTKDRGTRKIELNQGGSKPDSVNWSVRTTPSFFLFIFPFMYQCWGLPRGLAQWIASWPGQV